MEAVVKEVAALGLTDKTFLFYSSDHGFHLGHLRLGAVLPARPLNLRPLNLRPLNLRPLNLRPLNLRAVSVEFCIGLFLWFYLLFLFSGSSAPWIHARLVSVFA